MKYFVVYKFSLNGTTGTMSKEIIRDKPIRGFSDIVETEDFIRRNCVFQEETRITILNWQRFEDE